MKHMTSDNRIHTYHASPPNPSSEKRTRVQRIKPAIALVGSVSTAAANVR